LQLNVEKGSAKFVEMNNYSTGEMTSVSEKIVNGQYAEYHESVIFIGVVPVSRTEYIYIVML
jgi:hypothetical protein